MATVSIIASVSWLLYHKEVGSVASVLSAGSRSLTGVFALILFFASTGAYVLWRRGILGLIPQTSKSARKVLLFGVLVGGLGYSTALLSRVPIPVYSGEVVFSIEDGATGRPLSSASVKVTANGEPLPEGFSDVTGVCRLALPSRLSSSKLTVVVNRQGYQDVAITAFPLLGFTQRIQMQPDAPSAAEQPFKSSCKFSALPINLSLNEKLARFNYGFSSVESDRTITGHDIRIKRVRVDLKVRTHTSFGCCDVWVLMGPGPIHEPGPISESHYSYVSVSPNIAPVQAQFVIGGKPLSPERVVDYYATYDFDSKQWAGDVTITKDKAYFAPLLNLPSGLYAQILMWEGATAVNADIESLSLVVEGTKPTQQ